MFTTFTLAELNLMPGFDFITTFKSSLLKQFLPHKADDGSHNKA